MRKRSCHKSFRESQARKKSAVIGQQEGESDRGHEEEQVLSIISLL